MRASEAEQLLERKALSADRIATAVEKTAARLAPPGDFLGSAEYRREMALVLARRALHEARARAQAAGIAQDEAKEGEDENLADD